MKNKTTLKIFLDFPMPSEKSENIEDHFEYWRTLQIDALTPEEIILLGATGSTTNQKSRPGNFFFEINPIYIMEKDDDNIEEFFDNRKAIMVFKPSDKDYYLKQLIQHPSEAIMSARNKASSLIDFQKGNKTFPNNIQPAFINPALILSLKKDIIQFFGNMEDLKLENKRGKRRAMWTNEKGYFYLGICPTDYEYPNMEF